MASAPEVVTDPEIEESDLTEHGRVGYGRYARYTPLGIALAIVLALLVIGVLRSRPETDPGRVGQLIGQPAPDFSLTLLDGSALHLSDLRGSVVVLNFWAAWCPPCKNELPRFQALATDTATSAAPVNVVGIGLKNDYDGNARDLVRELGLTFPIGRDTAGDNDIKGPIELAYAISNYPTTVFIRPDGTVDAVHIGELDTAQIADYVKDAG